jgi:tRNA (guanine9-N1)-methyltransferase
MGAYTSKANTPEERNGTPKQSISSPENSKINLLSQEEQKDKHKISKNQLKRERKWQEKMEVKRRRKEQERNIRIAHAKVEGRDIEMERKIMEINRKNGAGWAKRDKKWKEDFEKKASKYQICIDCSFEKEMSTKEINSLASQIRYCYAANKRAKCPVHVKTTSLNGETLKKLQNVSGFSSWSNRAFGNSPESMEQVYDKTKLVYLTSDSDNELSKLEDDKVYVIGGIVDRNRLKRVAISRAEDLVGVLNELLLFRLVFFLIPCLS